MKISQEGIDLIKSFEGCRLTSYHDAVDVLTIGYGHTGNDVKEHQTITQAQADELLKHDLANFENGVLKAVKVKLTQHQFDSLVSFSYNVGLGALKKSTLLKKLNNGDVIGAANEFEKWCKAGGNTLKGLVKRRKAEKELFLKGEPTHGIIGTVKVMVNNLNIRKGAGTQFPSLGYAKKGRLYNVTANVNDWHRIILDDHDPTEAWVFGNKGKFLELMK